MNQGCQPISAPGSIDYSRDFQTTDGPSNGWTIPDIALTVAATGKQTIEWVSVKNVIDPYNTKINVDLEIDGGSFGIGSRKGQTWNGVYHENDMFLIAYENIGTPNEAIYGHVISQNSVQIWGPVSEFQMNFYLFFFKMILILIVCFFQYTGMPRLKTGAGNVNHLKFVLTTNDSARTIEVHIYDGGYHLYLAVNKEAFPEVGGVAYYFDNLAGHYPAISKAVLATTSRNS